MAQLVVRDMMSEKPYTLNVDDDLTALYDLMDSKHIRHLPVVDDSGELVGLVSHRDLVRSALFVDEQLPMSSQRDLLRQIKVREIMTAEVQTTEPESDLRDAADMMLDNKFGCLPVLEGTRLVGIITEADFVRYFARGKP